MDQANIPKLSTEEIIQNIRKESKSIENQKTISSFSLLQEFEKLKIVENPFINKSIYHVNEFCIYHDEMFIENVFQGALEREVTKEEMKTYLALLRHGKMSKKEIIAKIKFSTEGKQKSIVIKGIFIPFIMTLIYRIPLIGFLLKVFLGIIRLPSIIQQIRQLEAHSQIPEIKNEQLAELVHQALEKKADDIMLEQKANKSELDTKVDHFSFGTTIKNVNATLESLTTKLYKIELEQNSDKTELNKKIDNEILTTKLNEVLVILNEKIDNDALSKIQEQKVMLLDTQRRLNLLLEEARKRLPEPFSKQQIKNIVKQEEHIFDAMYVAFEDKFRGTRKDIKQRQEVYLPYIKAALRETGDLQILDMGCGRGEWLELLLDNDISAQGIDLNCIMIKECQERGLSAKEADIIEHLRNVKTESIAAVTGFHIIEHLPFRVMIAFLDECLRVLKPGGVIIFETPNPENLLVGACHFYTDPSHHNPLVPETMRFIIEQRGFEKTEIKRLHKYSEFFNVKVEDEFINSHFYNEMDFAIIGHKV